jgi:RNA polymerase sigma-70 factor (ECF subfamily)
MGAGVPIALPDQVAEANDLQTSVDAALSALPPRSRLIITLRWIDGLSYPEISEVLGISTDAAKKQGRRVELALRTLLARFAPP